MSQTLYTPILKWKQGERQALSNLKPEHAAQITPLLELPPGSDDGYLVEELSQCWTSEAPIFLELAALENSPIEQAHGVLREAGVAAIPVTGVYRAREALEATSTVAHRDRLGVCLRVTPEEVAEPTFEADLDAALETLKIGQAQVDIILDCGYLLATPSVSTGSMSFTAIGFLNAIPYISRWRSITYAATSFPETLAAVGTGAMDLPRMEWEIWRQISMRLRRSVRFGDYAISHPVQQSGQYTGSAAIRYTVDGSWLILRGRRLNSPAYGGYEQFRKLARDLVAESRFSGEKFSWGDSFIVQCAEGEDGDAGTGNSTTWRAVATNHHIAFVVESLANRSAPSNAHEQ